MRELSRREFFKTTGTIAAAVTAPGWLTACNNAPAALPEVAWTDLRSQMSGQLLLPGEPAYAVFPAPWNLRYADVRAAAVAVCSTPADVAAGVKFAHQNGV